LATPQQSSLDFQLRFCSLPNRSCLG
jgi:hypothetical protein